MVKPYKERRKGPDSLLRLLTWTNALAAVGLFAALCVAAVAKPEVETFFDRFYKVNVYRRPYWDMALVDYIAALLILSALTSIIGLIINSRRRRRKEDFIRSTLVLCLLLSVAGLGYYLVYI